MKVLFQQWYTDRGSVVSISKNVEQYNETVTAVEKCGDGKPEDGDPFEVTIPDNSVFAEMVQNETVFLHRDEEDIITFPE